MKQLSLHVNESYWHECAKCGKWFDRRKTTDDCCPDCGTNVNAMS